MLNEIGFGNTLIKNGSASAPARSGKTKAGPFTTDDLLLEEERDPERPKVYGAAEPIKAAGEGAAVAQQATEDAGVEADTENLNARLDTANEGQEAAKASEGEASETKAMDGSAGEPASHNVFSSAVFLMSRSAKHRHLFLADLEWRLMPPLALKQFRLFTKDNHPVALATWAMVSEAVEARLKGGGTHLKPEEWKSGDRRVVVDIMAPFGGEGEIKSFIEKG